MPHKRVLRPERLRQIPTQFSWIDQRLVRDQHTERCAVEALALYLVLVTIADAQGVSYYGEASLARLLSMPVARLIKARADLISLDLLRPDGHVAWAGEDQADLLSQMPRWFGAPVN